MDAKIHVESKENTASSEDNMQKETAYLIFELLLLAIITGILFLTYTHVEASTSPIPIELTNETFTQEIEMKLSEIWNLEQDFLLKNGRFANDLDKLPITKLFGFDIIIHEYRTPKGALGYNVFIRNENYAKSFGFGLEAISRSTNWALRTQ